jgi:hypothetical protein
MAVTATITTIAGHEATRRYQRSRSAYRPPLRAGACTVEEELVIRDVVA